MLDADPALAAPEHELPRAPRRRAPRPCSRETPDERAVDPRRHRGRCARGRARRGRGDRGRHRRDVGREALRLIVLSASLLAFAGGLGGLAVAAGEALVSRTRHPARWAGALWTLAFAPLYLRRVRAVLRPEGGAHPRARRALGRRRRPRPRGDLDRVRLSTFASAPARRARSRARWGWPPSAPFLANRFVLPRLYGLVPRHAVGDDRRAVRSRGAAAPACGPAARRDGRRARGRRGLCARAGRAAQQSGRCATRRTSGRAGRAGSARRPVSFQSRPMAAAERHAAGGRRCRRCPKAGAAPRRTSF